MVPAANPSDEKPPKGAAKPQQQRGVLIELNPASGVSVLGADPVLLSRRTGAREFTKAEADALLALRDPHGTPFVRLVKEPKRG